MSIEEQLSVKTEYYNEAMRYMSNAEETLKRAQKDGRFFKDAKYVKTACGTAYNGVLKALDGYLLLKNVPAEKRRKSIEYYQSNIAKLDKKLNVEVKNAYDILHLFGYYDGTTSVPVIKEGFDLARSIISRIAP
jgi:hypothetical protein